MANSFVFADLKAGRSTSTVEVRLLRFWKARNFKRIGELKGVEYVDFFCFLFLNPVTHCSCFDYESFTPNSSSPEIIIAFSLLLMMKIYI